MDIPEVTVIIPCRNEGPYIEECIASLVPETEMSFEFLIVDGMSDDDTVDKARATGERLLKGNYRILQNPMKRKTPGLNMGIREALGEIIIIADAHSRYCKNYIEKCVIHLKESGAVNVGGLWNIRPRSNTKKARAIAYALQSPLGTGLAKFKGGVSEPKEVDTVPFGCFWKKDAQKIGLFNENLVRTEDIDFNKRLRKEGGKIILFPDLKIDYLARDNYEDLWRNNYVTGKGVIWELVYTNSSPISFRHLVPLGFVLLLLFLGLMGFFFLEFKYSFISLVGLYMLLISLESARICRISEQGNLFFRLMVSFVVIHFSYGLGSFVGATKRILQRK